ncbi:PadR family transcriptional regulator [Gordonia sinesedis]
MRSTTTRLLLLGAVGLFEPVNGYQIRRELISWQADKWANINPGSIYHGLNSLAGDGLLARYDLTDGSREVAVYELTETGRTELDRLIADAILTVDVFDRRDFQAAFGLLPMLDAERGRELLAERHRRFAVALADHPTTARSEDYPYAPPHALRIMELTAQSARTEYDWLTAVLDDLRHGRLALDPGTSWAPPADDPGHEMTADRRRYRESISGRAAARVPPTSE